MAKSRNNALEFSSVGSVLASGGDTVTGTFGAIQILKDATLGTVVSSNVDQSSRDLGETFGAGTIIYGNFTSVQVAGSAGAGLVALHKV